MRGLESGDAADGGKGVGEGGGGAFDAVTVKDLATSGFPIQVEVGQVVVEVDVGGAEVPAQQSRVRREHWNNGCIFS